MRSALLLPLALFAGGAGLVGASQPAGAMTLLCQARSFCANAQCSRDPAGLITISIENAETATPTLYAGAAKVAGPVTGPVSGATRPELPTAPVPAIRTDRGTIQQFDGRNPRGRHEVLAVDQTNGRFVYIRRAEAGPAGDLSWRGHCREGAK